MIYELAEFAMAKSEGSLGLQSLSNVKRLVEAYDSMLQERFSSSTNSLNSSHIFYDGSPQSHRKTNRRTRPYRESPNDKRWLTWDATQKCPYDELGNTKFESFNKVASAEDLNCASDEGICDVSSSWLTAPSGGRHSVTSSVGSSNLSEDDFALSRSSSSCNIIPSRDGRSVSTDSAVDVDFISHKIRRKKSSPMRSISSDQCDHSVNLRIRPTRSDSCEGTHSRPMHPPSVVISDHSSDIVSFKIALINDEPSLPSFLRTASMTQVMEPLSAFGLSVSKICPRKVSECSTCSSVSTIDMSSERYLSLDELMPSRKTSAYSTCSSLTAADVIEEVEYCDEAVVPATIKEENVDEENKHSKDMDELNDKTSNWRKVKNVVQWTPFIQTYKKKKYPWVQLAGHQGNFKAGEKQGTILKKFCESEHKALQTLMTDRLKPYVPEYMGLVGSTETEQYIELQDLLSDFSAPCVMDVKMGVRTYLEDELAKAREKPKLRKDMYEKMIQIDENAPSEAEHKAKAVTKPRYMVWRETISSTATLGFRIEGVKKGDGSSTKDFKTTRTEEQVMEALWGFVEKYPNIPAIYLSRLKEIRKTLETSEFFMSHELIGSSLLFVHNEDKAVVYLIDFAKSIPLPPNIKVTHSSPWVEGTHEDGYLLGLDNLISIMTQLVEKSRAQKTKAAVSQEMKEGEKKSTFNVNSMKDCEVHS